MNTISLAQFFKMGGVFMIPLTVFSVATLGFIIERLIFFFSVNMKVADLEAEMNEKLLAGDVNGAYQICEEKKKNKLAARILKEGIRMFSFGEHRIEKALESETGEVIKEMERGFNFLTALASISPLTGFLGTVSGMISAFYSIANADEVNAKIVAGGIYEALITTVYGLIIAIVALTFYNIFAHIVDSFTANIEKTGTDLVNELTIIQNRK
jgi:biopolymer transport protein ExbB